MTRKVQVNMVKFLVDEKNFPKYSLSKELGVSWNTVHMWYLGIYNPMGENAKNLEYLYHNTKRG